MSQREPIEVLIERSSLGTAGARSLRKLTAPDVVARILKRAGVGVTSPKTSTRGRVP